MPTEQPAALGSLEKLAQCIGDLKARYATDDVEQALACAPSAPANDAVLSFAFERAHMPTATLEEGAVVCKKAIDIFNECYGSEVGVAALKWLPFGGLYISGGIAAKNPEWIKSAEFMNAYADKGRMSHLVKSVPLFVVLTEDTGERGALFYAVAMLK